MSNDLNPWIDPNEEVIIPKEETTSQMKNGLEVVRSIINSSNINQSVKKGFPIEVFPKEIQDVIKECNESANFHKDYLSAGIMSAIATAIGGDMRINNSKWWDAPILWNCIVGNAGNGKTHSLNWAMKPIEAKEQGIFDEYKSQMQDYEFNDSEGDKPVYLNRVFKDFTIETLAVNLEHNEKGLIVFNDELKGWISKMNAPNSAGDEDNWLESFNGNSITVNRMGREPLRVDRTSINVLGGIQPSRLSSITSGGRSESGFMDRLLFYYPEQTEPLKWNDDAELNENTTKYYTSIVNGIEARGYINFTTRKEDRLNIWKPWYEVNNAKYHEDDREAGLQSKLVTYFWRFALILEVLKQEVSKDYSNVISAESLNGAIELAEYFRGTANKVLDFTKLSPEEKLPQDKRSLFYDLPEKAEFTTGEAEVKGKEFGLNSKAVQRFLKDSKLFTKVSRGKYVRKTNRRS
jgi:hypothetical protein